MLSWQQTDPKDLFALYRNDLAKKHWIRVRPVGLAGNHGAAGAKIRIYAAGTDQLLWYEELGIYCRRSRATAITGRSASDTSASVIARR